MLMNTKKLYGETKFRVCSGTLAKKGRGNLILSVIPVQEEQNTAKITARYIDQTGTEHTLEGGEIENIIPVAGLSAWQNPREWIFPATAIATTWIGGPLALNYIYLKVSEGVFWLTFSTLAAAQTASVFYAGAALSRGKVRGIISTSHGEAVIEGSPFHMGLLAGLQRPDNGANDTDDITL